MKHIVITRVNFSNDEKFNNYFEVMKKYYIPSLNNQTNKNFRVIALTATPGSDIKVNFKFIKKIKFEISNLRSRKKLFFERNHFLTHRSLCLSNILH